MLQKSHKDIPVEKARQLLHPQKPETMRGKYKLEGHVDIQPLVINGKRIYRLTGPQEAIDALLSGHKVGRTFYENAASARELAQPKPPRVLRPDLVGEFSRGLTFRR